MLSNEELEEKEQNDAATKIQARWKGNQQRKQSKKAKEAATTPGEVAVKKEEVKKVEGGEGKKVTPGVTV